MVSYGHIYSVYQTQNIRGIEENRRNMERLSLFAENLNLVMCAMGDTKDSCVLTIVLRVVTITKHHREYHFIGY